VEGEVAGVFVLVVTAARDTATRPVAPNVYSSKPVDVRQGARLRERAGMSLEHHTGECSDRGPGV